MPTTLSAGSGGVQVLLPAVPFSSDSQSVATVRGGVASDADTLAKLEAKKSDKTGVRPEEYGGASTPAAFAAAVAAAGASDVKVLLKAGVTYQFEDLETTGSVKIVGEPGARLALASGATAGWTIDGDGGDVYFQDVIFDGLSEDRSASLSGWLLDIDNVDKLTMRGVGFEDWTLDAGNYNMVRLGFDIASTDISGGVWRDLSVASPLIIKSSNTALRGVTFDTLTQHGVRVGVFNSDVTYDGGGLPTTIPKVRRVSFQGCTFKDIGTGGVTGSAVLGELGTEECLIEHSQFFGCKQLSKFDNATRCKVRGNIFTDPQEVAASHVVQLSAGDIGSGEGNGLAHVGFECSGNYLHGHANGVRYFQGSIIADNYIRVGAGSTAISGMPAASDEREYDCQISGNIVRGEGAGLALAGSRHRVFNNDFDTELRNMQVIAADECDIAWNKCIAGTTHTEAIDLTGTATDCRVAFNDFRGNAAAANVTNDGSGNDIFLNKGNGSNETVPIEGDLSVAGDAAVTGTVTAATVTTAGVSLGSSLTTTDANAVIFNRAGVDQHRMLQSTSSGGGVGLYNQTDAGYTWFANGLLLGVGKTNPDYKLDSAGDINTDTAFRVGGVEVINGLGAAIANPNAVTAYTAPNISATYSEAEVQAIADAHETLRNEVEDLRAKLQLVIDRGRAKTPSIAT